MIKIDKLWGDAVFSGILPNTKLLYIYLCTQPAVSTLGVIKISSERVQVDLKLSYSDISNSILSLETHGFVTEVKGFLGYVTLIIPRHFKSLSKSKLNTRRAIDDYTQCSTDTLLKSAIDEIYSLDDFKEKEITPPTPLEVSDYAMSKGYIVNGNTFCNYYGDNDWYNKNNKKVRNWKATLDRVWCKDSNKLIFVKGAPKGFEYFYIETDSGERVFPESWDNGYPSHSNFLYTELLNNEFSKVMDK